MENNLPELTIREMSISEEIQALLSPIIFEYLDEMPSLIDALDWTFSVIMNDGESKLNLHGNAWSEREV